MDILDLFLNNKKLNRAKDIDIELYNQINKIKDRFEINTSSNNEPINFNISKDWERFSHSISGVILMREHYSNNNVKCVHNKWEKCAKLPLHVHTDCDQTIWVHNGALIITIYDENSKNELETKIITHRNIDQPFTIKKGVPHTIRAISDVDFVSRFDIYTLPSTISGFLN